MLCVSNRFGMKTLSMEKVTRKRQNAAFKRTLVYIYAPAVTCPALDGVFSSHKFKPSLQPCFYAVRLPGFSYVSRLYPPFSYRPRTQ